MMLRFQTLDGWRGISIILVLMTHLLPVGPKFIRGNETTGPAGMVIFFVLSGFLITNILYNDQSIINFLIKRLLRIVPLAWIVFLVTLPLFSAPKDSYLPHFLFYANWPPMKLIDGMGHFWSLCVEMQFYFFIAIMVAIFRKNALYFLPLICIAVTLNRYLHDVEIAINTYYRIDEILAGSCLALLYHSKWDNIKHILSKLSPIYLFPILILTCSPFTGVMNYFRPLAVFILVGSTLFGKSEGFVFKILESNILKYIAKISYALYVIHPILDHTWLGAGDKLIKYLKRPLLIMVAVIFSHLSTNYYEKHWINLGKTVIEKRKQRISFKHKNHGDYTESH